MKIVEKAVGTIDSKNVISYNMINSKGFEVRILNYGGVITDILVPDRNGVIENVVMKYKYIETYKKNPSYFGAIIGRTAGRIAEGKITLNESEINFEKNYGFHQGHGGEIGFNKKFWKCKTIINDDNVTLELSYLSPAYEENYPGNLKVKVSYTITENNELIISYEGVSDATTLVNVTNHSYFNLSGNRKENILCHKLFINGDNIIKLDSTNAVTADFLKVEGTPFDFRSSKEIGKDINEDHEQLKIGNGYDHVWMLNHENEVKISLYNKGSGRAMDILTDQPSVVVYSMNYTDEELLENGTKANSRDAICFETQKPPIGRNNTFLEYSTVNEGEEYKQLTSFIFYNK